jgi:hypothetical protein
VLVILTDMSSYADALREVRGFNMCLFCSNLTSGSPGLSCSRRGSRSSWIPRVHVHGPVYHL